MVLLQGARRTVERCRTRVFRLSLIVWLASLSMTVPGRADSVPDVIEMTAKLVDIPSKLPPDDLYDYAYVMRYEAIGGPLDKTSILVAHYKPLLPRSKIKDAMKANVKGKLRSFVQGDVHKLKLTPALKSVWKGPLIDEFAATDRKSTRYFCLEVDPG